MAENRFRISKGLALVAETEHALAKATNKVSTSASTRPSTAAPPVQDGDLANRLPKLQDVVEKERGFLEDRFQGQICIGWLHWAQGEYGQATARLPRTIDQEYTQFEALDNVSTWTKICMLKSAYLRADSLNRGGQPAEALETFGSSLPSLARIWAVKSPKKQLNQWSELYVTEYCLLQSDALQNRTASLEDPNCLACFRRWAKHWDTHGTPASGGYGFRGTVPRRRIWFEYYHAISEILKHDLPFPTGLAPVNNDSSARNQLRMELKQVEAKYEKLLLGESQFPKAEEGRAEVEAFVELVMENWTILNGRGWREADLGQGGKDTLSRGVLELLYRASTKTYHSTSILRHLYRVHLAVAEFDLAFKSLDSYLELVKKGKARVAKTGHLEPSLDDDAVAMETIASAIVALCRYGDRQAAEKARSFASELESWLENQKAAATPEDGMSPLREDAALPATQPRVEPDIMALSWQAVGLAHAQWARVTFEATSRSGIRGEAIRALQKSLSVNPGRPVDVRAIFSLGLLLAEQRELSSAIELAKTALLAGKTRSKEQELYNGPYWQERSLIPLWHLLSLLLSARQDYFMASRACEGAFEQFGDPAVLFGSRRLGGAYRSDHLNELEASNEKHEALDNGVVDDMDDYEKETILEIKMTQLSIIELLEGPKVAVNASLELFSLYSRLFGEPRSKHALDVPKANEVPKSSAGTLRSFRGAILGSGRAPGQRRHSVADDEKPPVAQHRPRTSQTIDAGALGLANGGTNDDEARPPRKSGSLPRRSESGRRGSFRRRSRSRSRKRSLSSSAAPSSIVTSTVPARPPTVGDGESFLSPFGESLFSEQDISQLSSPKRFSLRPKTPGRANSFTSNASNKPEPLDLAGISLDRLDSHPALLPFIRFSLEHEKRRKSAVLIKVWLMIAGIYRRSHMLADAQAAVAEAMKLAQGMETDAAKDTTGSVSLRHAGWAEKKGVEELWADVWSEVCQIFHLFPLTFLFFVSREVMSPRS